MKKWLLLLFVSGISGVALAQFTVSSQNRGANDDAVLVAAHRSVENQLMVEEIEDAGFEIDVEEGFDEEWEEDIWVATEADDVDANYLDPSESARYDISEVPQADEVAEGWGDDAWQNPDLVVEEEEHTVAMAEEEEVSAMRGEETASEDDAFLNETEASLEEELNIEEETEFAEANWWEEGSDNWSSLIEDMDTDEFDANIDDEEDLDLLEELYGTY